MKSERSLSLKIAAHSLSEIMKNHIFCKILGKKYGILSWPALYAAEQFVHPAFLTHQF